MDRKKTLLIAVMINAGLLAVLFVAALTTQEEISPSLEMGLVSPKERPLFPDSADMTLQQPAGTVALPPMPIPLSEVMAEPAPEAAVVHKLPPLVPEAPPEPVAAAAPAPPAPVKDTSLLEMTVKKGDSLDRIAKAHGTTVDEIIKLNHLPSSFLRVGQVLKLPAQKIAFLPKPVVDEKTVGPGPDYYTVKVGDNPWTIAMKHHMKVEELLKINGLNEERARKLKPGDRLRTR